MARERALEPRDDRLERGDPGRAPEAQPIEEMEKVDAVEPEVPEARKPARNVSRGQGALDRDRCSVRPWDCLTTFAKPGKLEYKS